MNDMEKVMQQLEPLHMSDAELEQRIKICENTIVRLALKTMLFHSRERAEDAQS